MTAEVYTSLLNSNDIINVSGYIWRVCENVYSRYVAKIKKQEGLCENYMAAITAAHMDDGITEEEKYKVRREISFLSELRRDIVFSFYYKNETIKKIAVRHGIPEGSVKWHLSKIRKEGGNFMKKRMISILCMNPIEANILIDRIMGSYDDLEEYFSIRGEGL